MNKDSIIGVIGAGAMGSGIAQVAAMSGHSVVLFDTNTAAIDKAKASLTSTFNKLAEKGKIADANAVLSRFQFATELSAFANCGLIIEAIIENLDIKKKVFADVEAMVSESCVLATNTSSLSVTSIAAACKKADRVIGLHFFNPAPLMALVEIIPAVQTDAALVDTSEQLLYQYQIFRGV